MIEGVLVGQLSNLVVENVQRLPPGVNDLSPLF